MNLQLMNLQMLVQLLNLPKSKVHQLGDLLVVVVVVVVVFFL